MKKVKNNIDDYDAEFGELSNFLVCYVGERKTDAEAIQDYIKYEYDTVELAKSEGREIDYDTIPQCIKEGREVLELQPFPWEWVGNSCNKALSHIKANSEEERYFIWTKWIIDTLEKEAIKAGKL